MHGQQINQLAAGEQSAVDRDEQWADAIPAERQRNLCRADKRNRRRRERRAWGVDACTWRRGPPRQDASAGECERHRLTQQRERAELADPTGLDERDAAIGQPHTRRAQFEIAVMPEDPKPNPEPPQIESDAPEAEEQTGQQDDIGDFINRHVFERDSVFFEG